MKVFSFLTLLFHQLWRNLQLKFWQTFLEENFILITFFGKLKFQSFEIFFLKLGYIFCGLKLHKTQVWLNLPEMNCIWMIVIKFIRSQVSISYIIKWFLISCIFIIFILMTRSVKRGVSDSLKTHLCRKIGLFSLPVLKENSSNFLSILLLRVFFSCFHVHCSVRIKYAHGSCCKKVHCQYYCLCWVKPS